MILFTFPLLAMPTMICITSNTIYFNVIFNCFKYHKIYTKLSYLFFLLCHNLNKYLSAMRKEKPHTR